MVHFLPPRAEHNSTACVLRSIKTSFYGCRQRRRLSSTRGEELGQVEFQFVSFSPRWVAIALITKFGLGMMGDLDTMRNEAFRKKVMRCNEKEYCYAGYSDTLQMERFICLSKSRASQPCLHQCCAHRHTENNSSSSIGHTCNDIYIRRSSTCILMTSFSEHGLSRGFSCCFFSTSLE